MSAAAGLEMSTAPRVADPETLRSWRSGCAAMTAPRCPGESISGTTVMSPARGEGDDPADLGLAQVLLRHDLGVRVGLDAEALVVGEVQAELVELQVTELAYPVLDPARREVLAGDVEHEPALRFRGPVVHHALRCRAAAVHLLLEGARSVEDAGLRGALDRDPVVLHGEGVRLRARGAVVQTQLDVAVPRVVLARVRQLEFPGQQLALVCETGVVHDDPATGGGAPAGAVGRGVLPYGGNAARGPGEG